jgi:hypothetical protein
LLQYRDDFDEDDERLRKIDAEALADEAVEETQSILNALQGKTVGFVIAAE